MRITFLGLNVVCFLVILLSNLVLNVNYGSLGSNQPSETSIETFNGVQLPSSSGAGLRPTNMPLSFGAPLQTAPDPPNLAQAPCRTTLPSALSPDITVTNTQQITGTPIYPNGVLVTTGGLLRVNGSGAILTTPKIVVQSNGILEVIRGAKVQISQNTQFTGGIVVKDSANLTMANGIFSATNGACILMNATSRANIAGSNLYSSSFKYGLVLSGSAHVEIDRGSTLGTLALIGNAVATVDSKKASANQIRGGLILSDSAVATVHGSNLTTTTLVFSGGTSLLDESFGLHPFGNETRKLSSSNLPVSWSLNLTNSNVTAWNTVSKGSARLIFTNSMATGNITSPLNIQNYDNANATLLANSSVSNIYAFNSSTVQVEEDPEDTISTASITNMLIFDATLLSLQHMSKFAIGQVVATGSSHVTYMNSPANGTAFVISGNAEFTLQNSTALWSKLAFSGSAVFLAQDSKVLGPSSQPADVGFSGSVTAVFTNTKIASITTSASANANVTNPGMALGEVESKDSSTLIITNTNILKASSAIDTSHLTITNSTPPDIDAFGGAVLTLDHAAVSIVTDNEEANVNLLHSNVTTLLVCILKCPSSTSFAPTTTVSNSILTTAIIAGQGKLSISKSTATAILAGAFTGNLALTDSNVTGRLSFNGGDPSVKGTLNLNGKINIQAMTIASVPNLLLEGVFSWNINRGNVNGSSDSIVLVSGDTIVHRMFRLRYVDAKTGIPLPNMQPYIPGKCVPTDNTNNQCYMGSKFGSDSNGYIDFTVSFGSSEITSTLPLASNGPPGVSVHVKGIRTSTTDYNSSTIAFSDDSVIAMSATEVFGVLPTLQIGLGLMLIATILPMTIRLVKKRKRSSWHRE